MWTIVLLFTWQFGSAMVIFLAALQNVPVSLYEAAECDGASKLQQFWRITVPLITPVIFFNMIMQMVHAFQEFNGPYMITEGGPLQFHLCAGTLHLRPELPLLQPGLRRSAVWVLFALVGWLSALSFWSSRYWVFYAGEKRRANECRQHARFRRATRGRPWLRYLAAGVGGPGHAVPADLVDRRLVQEQ
jgi:oligogalacturonide transport system permease protein